MLQSLLTEEGLQFKLHQEQKYHLYSIRNGKPDSRLTLPSMPEDNRKGMFPTRAFLNVLLIILTTAQVLLIINSHVYLHSKLVRSFMNFYADQQTYPDLFTGERFYLQINNITELQEHINYVMDTIDSAEDESFIKMDFSNANMYLYVQYHETYDILSQKNVFQIDPAQGIQDPFDSTNVTSLKQFLMHIHHFQISVQNLTVFTSGLYEVYNHRVTYHYDKGHVMNINYEFQIQNSLMSNLQTSRPQANMLIYLRLFYLSIFVIALISLYSNLIFIRRTFKQFDNELQSKNQVPKPPLKRSPSNQSLESQISKEEMEYISQKIHINIEARHITITNQRWQDYFAVIQFDILFSAFSNLLTMIGNAYLFFGREHQIIVGIACLLSWLTIFRLFRSNNKLNLMYQLIKMSLMSVIQFLISFFIVFLGYTFLGMCLFPRVIYFCSLNYTVTTLASMMAGDSISMFTTAITSEYSPAMAMFYIFSYIIMFMHAIHNTLTGIIKEYFILQKIELIKEQKLKNNEQNMTYIQEIPTQCQKTLSQYKMKLRQKSVIEKLRQSLLQNITKYDRKIRLLFQKLQYLISTEKWQAYDKDVHKNSLYLLQQKQKLEKIARILIDMQRAKQAKEVQQNQSVISREDDLNSQASD